MTHRVFRGDPRPANVILLVLALGVGIALVAYVWHQSRNVKREHLEEEAEETVDTMMPGSS